MIKNTYFLSSLLILHLVLIACVSLGLLPALSSLLLIVLFCALWGYQFSLTQKKALWIYLSWFMSILFALMVSVYRPSDFSFPLLMKVDKLHEGGAAFTLYLNIAKMLAGYVIGFVLLKNRIKTLAYIQSPILQLSTVLSLGVVFLSVAVWILDLHVFIKSINYIVIFGAANLFATCVVEEMFMRLLLQEQLQRFLSKKLSRPFLVEIIPLLVVTVIFGLLHFTPRWDVLGVFTLAGFVYAVAYALTKRIALVIALHFFVNIVHFSLLTYPL